MVIDDDLGISALGGVEPWIDRVLAAICRDVVETRADRLAIATNRLRQYTESRITGNRRAGLPWPRGEPWESSALWQHSGRGRVVRTTDATACAIGYPCDRLIPWTRSGYTRRAP
jgi:hypothetical protein